MRQQITIGLSFVLLVASISCGGEPGYIGDPSVIPDPNGQPVPPVTNPGEQDIRDFVTPTTDRFTLFLNEQGGPLDQMWAYHSEASASLEFSIIGDTGSGSDYYPDSENPPEDPTPGTFHPEKFRMALGTISLSVTDITRGIDLTLKFNGEMDRVDYSSAGLEGTYTNREISSYDPTRTESWSVETATTRDRNYDYRGFEFTQVESAYANLFGSTPGGQYGSTWSNPVDCEEETLDDGERTRCGVLYEVILLEATPGRMHGTYRVMMVGMTQGEYDNTTGDYGAPTVNTVTEINGDFDITPEAFGISGELGE